MAKVRAVPMISLRVLTSRPCELPSERCMDSGYARESAIIRAISFEFDPSAQAAKLQSQKATFAI